MGRCTPSRPHFSGRQQTIRPRESDEGSLYRARRRFRARFDFPSLGTVDGRPPDVRLRSCLRGSYGAATGLRLAKYIIMATVTEKEKLRPQEEPRDFFCVVSDAFRI